MMEPLLIAFVTAAVAWAIYVERRLSRADARLDAFLAACSSCERRGEIAMANVDRKLDKLFSRLEGSDD